MKELIKKFSAFSLGPIIGAIFGFLNIPAVTYFISADEYGKASIFIVAQGTISMLVYLGLDQAFVREFHIIEDKKKLLFNAIIIPLAIVAILDLVIFFAREYVSILLFDTPKEINLVYGLMVLIPFMIIENFALLKIRMEEKGLQYSLFTILLKFLTLMFTLGLFIIYEKSFRSAIYAIVCAEVINGIMLYFVAFRKVGRFTKEDFDKELITSMLKFGLPLIPASMIGWALSSMDKVMLRAMCTYSELGLYAAAFKIVTALGIIQTCFTLFWTPVAYRWYEEKRDTQYFENVGKLVSLTMVTMCLGLLLVKDLIVIVLGGNYREAIYIFPFIVLFPIMYTMSEATAVGIGFTRKTQYNIIVATLSGGLNILLNYLLIPTMEGKGAALATGISYVVFFWIRTLISRHLWYKFPVGRYFIYTILIVINCIVHTFILSGYIPYLVSGLSLICVLVLNSKDIKETIVMIKGKRLAATEED